MKTNFSVRAFFLEPTDQVELSLRRYRSGEGCKVSRHGYCDVTVVLERLSVQDLAARGWPMHEGQLVYDGRAIAHDDPRWPARCGCGYEFQEGDQWCADPDTLFRRSDSGELITLDAAPAGAMWFAPWFSDHPEYTGPDGNTLVVRCPPGHDWIVDSRASNCDSPCKVCGVPAKSHKASDQVGHAYVDAKPHKCWVRTGTPPNVTAGKTGGPTCGAGGGSIATPEFHGFLRNGVLSGELKGAPDKPAAPAEPSVYVKVSEMLKAAAAGVTQAELSRAFPQGLDHALKKGKAKGTFVETGGTWRHVTR